MKKLLLKKLLQKFLDNEIEKEIQICVYGMCILDKDGNVVKIQDISEQEWHDMVIGVKDINRCLKK